MKKFMMFVAFAAMCVTANAQKWAYESNYTEGIACVKDANGKWGHINEQGNWRKIDKTGKFIE